MVAMTGEGPGTRPTKKPMKEPRMIGQNERFHSTSVGQSSRNRTFCSCTLPDVLLGGDQHFRNAEEPHGDREEIDALGQERLLEGVAHVAGHGLHADRAEREPDARSSSATSAGPRRSAAT